MKISEDLSARKYKYMLLDALNKFSALSSSILMFLCLIKPDIKK